MGFPPLFSFYLLSAKIIPNPRPSSRSQQSLSAVVIKVSCHPPDLIFLVGIPSTSEDAGNPFHLAETSPTQAGAWKGCSLNSRFFRPVVSIPHAFPGAKRSSSARLLSHLTGRMWSCTCLHFVDTPPPSEFHAVSALIVYSSSPSHSYLTPPPSRAAALTWGDRWALSNSSCILIWA